MPLGPVCQQRVVFVVRRRRQIVSESATQWVGDAVTRTLSGINEVWRARNDGDRPTPDGDEIVPLVIPYRNRELSPVQKVATSPVSDHTATACMRQREAVLVEEMINLVQRVVERPVRIADAAARIGQMEGVARVRRSVASGGRPAAADLVGSTARLGA